MEHYYSVIMAGGVGKRFWPLSRRNHPKQLLDLSGQDSMINLTINRLKALSPIERIYILTNKIQAKMILEQNDELSWDNFIIEPYGKNTAPAIGLAACILQEKDPESIMGLFPADHLITNIADFTHATKEAIRVAEQKDALFTFGIDPTYPATGFGYIQVEKENIPESDTIYKSVTFAEKPNYETAQRFMESGEFLWNSGMFVWQTRVILSKIKKYLPELGEIMEKVCLLVNTPDFDKEISRLWKTIKPISIDYGVLEQSSRIKVIKAKFDWNDVGSWKTAYKLSPKDKNENVMQAPGFLLRSHGNFVYSKKNLKVFTLGVDDLIIVEHEGVLLIMPKNESENIKEIVDSLPVIGETDLQ